MKKIYSLIVLLIFSQNIHGQNAFKKVIQQPVFQKEIIGNSIERQSNSDLLISTSGIGFNGYSTNTGGLFRLDSNANLKWGKLYEPPVGSIALVSAMEADSGMIISFGTFRQDTISPSEAFVMKTDSSGNFIWGFHYRSTVSDSSKGTAMIRTTDNNFILASASYYNSGYGYGTTFLKINSNGNIIWQRRMGLPVSGMVALANGEFASNGHFINSLSVLKYDMMGNIIWTRYFIFNNTSIADYLPVTIDLTADSGIVIAGNVVVSSGTNGIAIIKLDLSANILWQKKYSPISDHRISQLKVLKSGNMIATSNSIPLYWNNSSHQSILLVDTAGNPLNFQAPGTGTDYLSGIAEHPDGSLILTGFTASSLNTTGLEVIKTDTSFNYGCTPPTSSTVDTFSITINVVNTGIQQDSVNLNSLNLTVSDSIFNETVECITTDIGNPMVTQNIKIYPNPSNEKGIIHFEDGISGQFHLTIHETSGKTICKEINVNNHSLSLADFNLSPGIYFIVLSDGERYFKSKLVINTR